MYIPTFNRMDDDEVDAFIHEHGFGILVSTTDAGESVATHLPLLLVQEAGGRALLGHMARANRQWHGLDGREVLCIFNGPHAYVSPTWYEQMAVPTWNYVAAHVYGTYHTLEEEALWSHLVDLVRRFEPQSPLLHVIEQPQFKDLRKAVAGFRIEVKRVEAKKKLSQNKSLSTRRRVIEQLSSQARDDARRIADWMLRTLAD